MLAEEIRKWRTAGEETRMALLLAIHCSPVLKGIKAANMLTVAEADCPGMKSLLEHTGISSRFFRMKEDKGILYLYREKELKRYLGNGENRLFLSGFGYRQDDFPAMLAHLENRMFSYYAGRTEFPHEIGIFLEYPLVDVKGFVENAGKNFILSGYWKVYGDGKRTAEKFKRYDEERERTVAEVISGRRIDEIYIRETER
ncbi:MAG: DUF3793 family protein [Bacteroidales bacterium]|nr:DUF3793 family protein [Clostridium sp.]MCM1202851.1 DUF3793 family protein [Bacteroidales bacterium]